MSDWLITIAGCERHDGEKPTDYVIDAATQDQAVMAAILLHSREHDDLDLEVVGVSQGAPGPDYPYFYNDVRGGEFARRLLATGFDLDSLAALEKAVQALEEGS